MLKVEFPRTPFRDTKPATPAPMASLPKRYNALVKDLSNEASEVDASIREVETRLELDRQRADRVGEGRPEFTSLKSCPDLLTPPQLMELQCGRERLRAKRESLNQNLVKYRALADNWNLRPAEAKRNVIERFAADDEEAFAAVAVLAGSDPEAVDVLTYQVKKYLLALIAAAHAGNPFAVKALIEISSLGTLAVNDLPIDTLKESAAKRLDWPVMVARKRNFYRDSTNALTETSKKKGKTDVRLMFLRNPYEWVESLQLSSNAGIKLAPETNWIPDAKARDAWGLLAYVEEQRRIGRAIATEPSWIVDPLTQRAAELEELSADTWKAWWDVIAMVIDETYPKDGSSKYKYRSIRSAKKRDLKDKFKSFVGANKSHRKTKS